MFYIVVSEAWDIVPFESLRAAREHLAMLRIQGNRMAYLVKGL